MSEKLITFRVDEDLKKAFELVGKKKDLSSSQMLRAYMRETVEQYIKNEAQGDFIGHLKAQGNTKPKTRKNKKNVLPDEWRAK